ncbi:hypothetical protein H8356DRAFT_1419052 [Neocallimastix lanati (nom. inval.)]|nr:hypothetical protein H8356DRAFT_1419052 [Neocallimastix sp. JGI-2020a]
MIKITKIEETLTVHLNLNSVNSKDVNPKDVNPNEFKRLTTKTICEYDSYNSSPSCPIRLKLTYIVVLDPNFNTKSTSINDIAHPRKIEFQAIVNNQINIT